MNISIARERITPRSKFLALATALSIGAVGGFAVAQVAQPHMQAAMNALRTAAAELQQSTPDKGGHREKAIGFVEQATRQVEAGMAVGNR